jgi:hypothetical protein
VPLAWHYTTEFCRGLGVFDLMQADVAYLQVVQSRREDAAVCQPEVFLQKHSISQYSRKINRIERKTWHYIFEPAAHRQQSYQYLTSSA